MILPAHAPTAPVAIPQAVTTARRLDAAAARAKAVDAAAAAAIWTTLKIAAATTGAVRTATRVRIGHRDAPAAAAMEAGHNNTAATTKTAGLTHQDAMGRAAAQLLSA